MGNTNMWLAGFNTVNRRYDVCIVTSFVVT